MKLQGIIPAMVTPVDENQNINFDATKQLIEYLIENNADAIFIFGTNGEFHMFTEEDKVIFTKFVSKEINGRAPLIVGSGDNSTKSVINLSTQLVKAGADILSVITPYFTKPSQKEIETHFRLVANKIDAPILMYNIPKLTGVNIEKNIIYNLSDCKNIIGIKDSSGDIENIKSYIDAKSNDHFSVICGTDSLILEAFEKGASGAIASTANVVPDIVSAIYSNWMSNDYGTALKYQESLDYVRNLFGKGTLPSVLKEFITQNGINVGGPILPTLPPSKDVVQEVENALKVIDKIRRTTDE